MIMIFWQTSSEGQYTTSENVWW